MVELKSFPFDSIADDREYPAAIFRNYFHKFLSTGVYFGKYKNYGDYSMKVVTSLGLNVRVTKGAGIIKGLDFELENDAVLPVNLSLGKIRKDMVVVKADDTLAERKTSLYIKEGTDADFATLERTADVYELCLAKITVGDTKTTVDLDDIEDTRRNSDFAGIVTSLIDIDIQDVLDDINLKKSQFFAQLGITTKAEADELIEDLSNYCDTVKDTLSGDVAVNLLNIINSLQSALNKTNTNLLEITPRRKILTLLSSNWTLNTTTNKYEYIIEDSNITENDFPDCALSEEDKKKISDLDQFTENGRLILTTSKQVTENINMTVVLIRTVEGGDT